MEASGSSAAINWLEAIKYAGLVKIAESVQPGAEYGQPESDAIKAAGYSYLQTLYGDDLATDIDAHAGKIVTFGFLAASADGELVAAIRGTDTILEWIHDAEFLMVSCPISGLNCGTDDGFTAVYKSLRNGTGSSAKEAISGLVGGDSLAIKTVTICGHSLGAALATLLALDVALSTPAKNTASYTFASPRVGDATFADTYKKVIPNTFRIANRMDLVSMLPSFFPVPYEHVAQHVEIRTKPPLLGSIPCLHHLTSYLWLLSQLAGVPGYTLDADCIENAGAKKCLT